MNLFDHNLGKIDLEVGFGRGLFLHHYAKLFPDRNIIGVEVRGPLIDIEKERLCRDEIRNVLPIHSTAEICLNDLIVDQSLERIFVFHPDPWFKKRHYKRRVISPEFLMLCARRLVKKGRIYISTDVEELMVTMNQQIQLNPCFKQIKDDEFWSNIYTGNWKKFSQVLNRTEFTGVYELVAQ